VPPALGITKTSETSLSWVNFEAGTRMNASSWSSAEKAAWSCEYHASLASSTSVAAPLSPSLTAGHGPRAPQQLLVSAVEEVALMLDKRSYETKFADLINMCAQAKTKGLEGVVIHNPHALGDNYDEMVESLNRLADAELQLSIVPRAERGGMKPA
jgi:hypothetical protein